MNLKAGKIFYLNSPGDQGLISSKTDLTYSGEFGRKLVFLGVLNLY